MIRNSCAIMEHAQLRRIRGLPPLSNLKSYCFQLPTLHLVALDQIMQSNFFLFFFFFIQDSEHYTVFKPRLLDWRSSGVSTLPLTSQDILNSKSLRLVTKQYNTDGYNDIVRIIIVRKVIFNLVVLIVVIEIIIINNR